MARTQRHMLRAALLCLATCSASTQERHETVHLLSMRSTGAATAPSNRLNLQAARARWRVACLVGCEAGVLNDPGQSLTDAGRDVVGIVPHQALNEFGIAQDALGCVPVRLFLQKPGGSWSTSVLSACSV